MPISPDMFPYTDRKLPASLKAYAEAIDRSANNLVRFMCEEQTANYLHNFRSNEELRLRFGEIPVIYADSGSINSNAGVFEGNTLAVFVKEFKNAAIAGIANEIDEYIKEGFTAALEPLALPESGAKTNEQKKALQTLHDARSEAARKAAAILNLSGHRNEAELMRQLFVEELGDSVQATYRLPAKEPHTSYSIMFSGDTAKGAENRLRFLETTLCSKASELGKPVDDIIKGLSKDMFSGSYDDETKMLTAYFEGLGLDYSKFRLPPRIAAAAAGIKK